MKIPFVKYSATGNDFVAIDARKITVGPFFSSWITKTCHRQNGIGSDGIIFLENPPVQTDLDFKMTYFNSDGGEAGMCGNGARAILHFAQSLGLAPRQKDCYRFVVSNKTYSGRITNQLAGVEFPPPTRINEIDLKSMFHQFSRSVFIDTGVPHALFEVSNLSQFRVLEEGRILRHHPIFSPTGANINFFHVEENKVHMRTYERGVENETLSCGSGAVALGLYLSQGTGTVEIHTRGGQLQVEILPGPQEKRAILWGEVQRVFDGFIEL